ncbi:hypothetical protein ACHAP3_006164 [Botrytis cinerea]
MSRSLDTLPTEIICEVVKILPFEDARNFLSCGSSVREPGKHAFNQNCFRVLPVRLSHDGLLKAEELLRMEPACFVQEVFIKMEAFSTTYEDRLGFILRRALQASTKIDTITIHYDPDFYDPGLLAPCLNTEVLARALGTTLEHQQTPELRIQIQNIRIDDCRALSRIGQSFLYRVCSLVLRIEEYDWAKSFQSLASLTENLEELSVINNAPDFLTTSAIQKIISKINTQTLESITLAGVSISINKLTGSLSPLKASLKKLQLQRINFRRESFETFIHYLSDNFSSDGFSLSLEDIWETDRRGTEYEIHDPMSYWSNPRPVSANQEGHITPASQLFTYSE